MLKGVPVLKSFVDQGLNVQHQTELLGVLHSPRLDPCLWEYVVVRTLLRLSQC